MAYITDEELRDQVDSKGTLDTGLFTGIPDAVTEAIDRHCFRSFEVPTTETDRYFKATADRREVADLDDIANATGLAVALDLTGDQAYSTVLSYPDDFVYETNNSGLVVAIRARGRFFPDRPYLGRPIQVTARFGWPAVPAPVKRAALIWGVRLWNRKDTPSGVVNFGDVGAIRLTKIDPDVSELLAPFVDRGRLIR